MLSVDLSIAVPDLEGVLALQRLNHARALAAEQWHAQGFVTMEYTVPELQSMCGPYRHAVAKSGEQVVGYALVMLKEHGHAFPLLDDMFKKIATGAIAGTPIANCRYVVMGQVCIDAAFRGMGIFDQLYQALKRQLQLEFDYIITEVSDKNGRSMGAHVHAGFRDIQLLAPDASEWHVMAWDWT
ncbi:MAG: GNAT family N-acetyltransferase [Pseudomonadota bacterium]